MGEEAGAGQAFLIITHDEVGGKQASPPCGRPGPKGRPFPEMGHLKHPVFWDGGSRPQTTMLLGW